MVAGCAAGCAAMGIVDGRKTGHMRQHAKDHYKMFCTIYGRSSYEPTGWKIICQGKYMLVLKEGDAAVLFYD